jgi:dTMP kinase
VAESGLSGERLVVAVEGIDRAGKTTQTDLLRRALVDAGETVAVLSFPRYDTFFGRTIRELLDGQGATSAATVDPRSMSLWYALDRWQAFRSIDPSVTAVLLNRFTLSNAVYQSARVAPDEAAGVFDWVVELEYGQLGLPRPDLTLVLDVAVEVSRDRSHRTGGPGARDEAPDVYERSRDLLQRARDGYRAAAEREPGIEVIECSGPDGALLPVDEIHGRVLTAVRARRPGLV